MYVLDLGGGKGGDFRKYNSSNVKHVEHVDIAYQSLVDASKRFQEDRNPPSFSLDLVCADFAEVYLSVFSWIHMIQGSGDPFSRFVSLFFFLLLFHLSSEMEELLSNHFVPRCTQLDPCVLLSLFVCLLFCGPFVRFLFVCFVRTDPSCG